VTSLTPNAQRLLRTLVVEGPAYRADLARTLGVSRATVTNLTNLLTTEGWTEEINPEPGSLKNHIGTTTKLGVLASVVFLHDTVTAAIAALDGRVLRHLTLSTSPDASAAERLDRGAELVDGLLSDLPLPPSAMVALHLAVDTQMDAQSGNVEAQGASSRWYGVNPKQYFTDRFGVPVHTQNTARLKGLAEHLWGSGGSYRDAIHVEISHGITFGHIVDGVLLSSARGGSGEIGHAVYDWSGPACTCGNTGCLMQYSSAPAILRTHATATGAPVSWEQFAGLVRQGDPTATDVARRSADVLGRMLVNTCHMIDPEALVLSGEVARDLPSFTDDVAAVIHAHALPLVGRHLHVVTAQLQDTHIATARAGIESLRAIDDVVVSVTTI
jgi:predicted NBD/HSP70 family sugar kinase